MLVTNAWARLSKFGYCVPDDAITGLSLRRRFEAGFEGSFASTSAYRTSELCFRVEVGFPTMVELGHICFATKGCEVAMGAGSMFFVSALPSKSSSELDSGLRHHRRIHENTRQSTPGIQIDTQ